MPFTWKLTNAKFISHPLPHPHISSESYTSSQYSSALITIFRHQTTQDSQGSPYTPEPAKIIETDKSLPCLTCSFPMETMIKSIAHVFLPLFLPPDQPQVHSHVALHSVAHLHILGTATNELSFQWQSPHDLLVAQYLNDNRPTFKISMPLFVFSLSCLSYPLQCEPLRRGTVFCSAL